MQNSFITPNAGEFISVQGLRLHFVSLGTGRVVVLLHGNAGFAQDFSLVLPALAEKDFRAIAFDRPGHGESERPVGKVATVALQADLIREALRELRVEKPILVGHSWGALVVLQYALLFPTEASGLVLLAPAVYHDEEQFGIEKSLIEIPRIGNLILKMSSPFIDREIRSNLVRAFAPDEVPADYLKLAITVWNRPERIKAVIQDEAIYNPTVESLSRRYDKVQTETIILTGDSDMEVDPEKHAIPLHWEIAHSQLRVLPATGHMIPHTRPQAVLDAIESIKTRIP